MSRKKDKLDYKELLTLLASSDLTIKIGTLTFINNLIRYEAIVALSLKLAVVIYRKQKFKMVNLSQCWMILESMIFLG